MKLINKFPKGFFEIPQPEATPSENPDDKIIPIKWNKKNKKLNLVRLNKKI